MPCRRALVRVVRSITRLLPASSNAVARRSTRLMRGSAGAVPETARGHNPQVGDRSSPGACVRWLTHAANLDRRPGRGRDRRQPHRRCYDNRRDVGEGKAGAGTGFDEIRFEPGREPYRRERCPRRLVPQALAVGP